MTKPALWKTAFPGQVREGQRERKDREQELYLKEAAAFKRKHPWCRVCTLLSNKVKPRRTEDIHHRLGRAGKLLRNQEHWVPICRYHHTWIGNNIEDARKLGLVAGKGRWNKC